jgi:hypothetical protein
MDVVTQSLLKEFSESQKIDGLGQADQFEAFVNYIVVADIYPEEFDFSVVATGPGEFGIDGIAIIVNDAIVDDEEQLEDIIAHSPVLQVQFLFIQAKTSASFDSGSMAKFSTLSLTSLRKKQASIKASASLSFSASRTASIRLRLSLSSGCPSSRCITLLQARGRKTGTYVQSATAS